MKNFSDRFSDPFCAILRVYEGQILDFRFRVQFFVTIIKRVKCVCLPINYRIIYAYSEAVLWDLLVLHKPSLYLLAH